MRTIGTQFAYDDGTIFKYVGVSAFAAFSRWLQRDGPHALVEPNLREWRLIADTAGYHGPIVLRVFRYAAPPNRFALDPWSYSMNAARAFTEFCYARNFWVDWTCGDSQIVLPNPDGPRGQQQHLNEFCASMVGLPNVFIETSNEPFKNGIDVSRVIPPQWGSYLRDSGAYGDHPATDFEPVLDFTSFHSPRGTGDLSPWPKWLIDMDDQAAYILNTHQVPLVLKEPIGADEMDIPGRRSANPALFGRMGLMTAFAGVTFHSTDGMNGDGLRPVQRACAGEFFKGVTGAMLV